MKRLLGLALIGLAGCQPTVEAPQSAPAAAVSVAQQGQIGALLNAQRSAQGLGPLSEDRTLSRAARAYAQDMVTHSYFSHTGRDGSSFVDRAQAAGYSCVSAENLAEGQRTEVDVVTAWMNSSGHRRNILLGDAAEYGIGRVDNMWVLMLGRGC
jgi:uncharacterized protein YkwD